MKFTVAIYSHPEAPSSRTALEFVRSTLAAGYEVYRLFFFAEGAATGDAHKYAAVSQRWTDLIVQHELDAVVCVNSAEQQGIAVNGNDGRPLAPGFVIGGLAQLIDGTLSADRFITFG